MTLPWFEPQKSTFFNHHNRPDLVKDSAPTEEGERERKNGVNN